MSLSSLSINARRLGHMGSHEWEHDGLVHTFTWVGDEERTCERVYALAFDENGRMLLVGDDGPDQLFWLPGGGVEAGESDEEALVRELREEVGGSPVMPPRSLGVTRVDLSDGRIHHHRYYWSRITLDPDFTPEHEILVMRHVMPEEFLDTLFWGRSDPKGEYLLERAVEENRRSL